MIIYFYISVKKVKQYSEYDRRVADTIVIQLTQKYHRQHSALIKCWVIELQG